MKTGEWIKGDEDCPRCGQLIEELNYGFGSNEFIVGERCVKCKWQIDLSGDRPRKVIYSGK